MQINNIQSDMQNLSSICQSMKEKIAENCDERTDGRTDGRIETRRPGFTDKHHHTICRRVYKKFLPQLELSQLPSNY